MAADPRSSGSAPSVYPERLEKFRTIELAAFQAELQKHTRSSVVIEIDLASLLYRSSADENSRILDLLAGSVFNNLGYALREAHAKLSFKNRVAVVRLERALSAALGGRCIVADNSRIIYRLDPENDALFYYTDDLELILPALIAGMPPHIDPRLPNAPGPVTWLPVLAKDPAAEAAAYHDHALAAISDRASDVLKRGVGIEFDFSSITTTAALEGLLLWGPTRIPGALASLCTSDDDIRALLASAIQTVRFEVVTDQEKKSIQLRSGQLLIRVEFSAGETGAYYEHEIASALRTVLHLAERPQIEAIRREAFTWQKELDEQFCHPISYKIDFNGFISHPDSAVNLRGLYMLKEHGVDHLYYAVSNLAKENPNFKQQFRDRVDTLRLVHVATPGECGITAEGSSIVYRLHLHSGYTGYLTLQDLTDQLPALVASLEDSSFTLRDEREPFVSSGLSSPSADELEDDEVNEDQERAELDELRELAKQDEERLADIDEDKEEEVDDEEEAAGADEDQENVEEAESPARPSAFDQMREQINAVLPVYSTQMEQILGKPIPLFVDWNSLDGDAVAVGELLNAALTPILGGLSVLGADGETRRALHVAVKKITLRRAKSAKEHGFSLAQFTLTFSAFLTKGLPATDPQLAATLIRTLLMDSKPKSRTKKVKLSAKPSPRKTGKSKTAAAKSVLKKTATKRKKGK